MRLLYRYIALLVAVVALFMTSCEIGLDVMVPPLPPSPDIPIDGDPNEPGYGVKPTVPLKRRPIVPSHKLPRPRIIERISWTESGTLSVALTENAPVVVTLVERDGTMRGYVADGCVVEIGDVPTEAFELQIDVDGECYSVMVEYYNENLGE